MPFRITKMTYFCSAVVMFLVHSSAPEILNGGGCVNHLPLIILKTCKAMHSLAVAILHSESLCHTATCLFTLPIRKEILARVSEKCVFGHRALFGKQKPND